MSQDEGDWRRDFTATNKPESERWLIPVLLLYENNILKHFPEFNRDRTRRVGTVYRPVWIAEIVIMITKWTLI